MKKVLCISLLLPAALMAQNNSEHKFGISFTGFVKTDAFYDTRQTVSIREGHFLVLPENIMKDQNGKDINASPNTNMLSIQSRIKGTITGPDAFGAKTTGIIEADFFGNENLNFQDVNGFRLRHAYVKLSWTKVELLAGQYWHPMFVPEAFPAVISFNTGAPFQPFSRNPQIRFSYKLTKSIKAMATAFAQRDFTSIGPDPDPTSATGILASSKYLRNSSIPNLNLQLQFNPDSSDHQFNLGVDYKIIKPELYTLSPAKVKTASNTTLGSISVFGMAKIKTKPVTVKIYGAYSQNGYDLVMMGGYAVSAQTDTNGTKTFTNLNTLTCWTEVHTNSKKLQLGIFGGFSKNLGSTDSISKINPTTYKTHIYARGSNISYAYRIAPRIVFISGKVNIAIEEEYTVAAFGKANGDGKGGVTGITSVGNSRTMLSFIYNF